MYQKSLLNLSALSFLLLLLSSCFDSQVGSEAPTVVGDTIADKLTTFSDTTTIETKDSIRFIQPVAPDTLTDRLPYDPGDPLDPLTASGDIDIPVPEAPIEKEDTTIYDFVQVFPEYPGGKEALNKELFMNLAYPEVCKEMGAEGTLYISFVVEKNGTLSNFLILREIKECPLLNEKVIQAFKKLKGTFSPGIMNDEPERTRMKWPVRIRLE
jgi:periplasmic protein TonB